MFKGDKKEGIGVGAWLWTSKGEREEKKKNVVM